MNKARREALKTLQSSLEDLQGQLESLKDEESEYYDAMPEGLQQSENGQKAEAAVDALDEALTHLGDCIDKVEESRE